MGGEPSDNPSGRRFRFGARFCFQALADEHSGAASRDDLGGQLLICRCRTVRGSCQQLRLQLRRRVRPDVVELVSRQPPRAARCLLRAYPPRRYPFVDGLRRDAVLCRDLSSGQPLTLSLRAIGDMQSCQAPASRVAFSLSSTPSRSMSAAALR